MIPFLLGPRFRVARPRRIQAALTVAAFLFISPNAFAQSTDRTARRLPELSSYACEKLSPATTASTRHIGQVIKGRYTEWYESYVLSNAEQRLACVSIIKPRSQQLSADEVKTFLTDSFAVGTLTAAGERAALAATEPEAVTPEYIQMEPLKGMRESALSSDTATKKLNDVDLPPLPASKIFGLDATVPSTDRRAAPALAPTSSYEAPATAGIDDRIAVTSTQAYPWNTVAYFTSTYPNGGSYRCSATLVSPYVVLTAGHCVHNTTRGGYIASGRVYPGQGQNNLGDGTAIRPFPSKADIASVQTSAQWTQMSGSESYPVTDYRYDYGAVMFNTPFTHTSTFMPVLYSNTAQTITSAGYPAMVQNTAAYGLYTSSGSETSKSGGYRSSHVREFAVDASGGNSGGPFIYVDPATGQNYLVGSLSYGDELNDHSGGPWYDSWNQALISSWVSWTPGKESIASSTAGLRVASVFGSTQPEMMSYLRFYNSGSAAGTVDVTLSDYATGSPLATWRSPTLPAHSSRQFSITELENNATTVFNKPMVYSLSVRSTFGGSMQNVLWRKTDATVTNLSTCDARDPDPMTLINVHSSLLDNGYPSAVIIYNTATSNVSPTFGIYSGQTGQRLGTYAPGVLAANSQTIVTMSTLEAAAGISPGGTFHYNIKADVDFQGFLQHLLNNQAAHLVADMTATCSMAP